MVSIKPQTSYRPYPNTRKHPINMNSSTTRRQTRLSYVIFRYLIKNHTELV